MTKMIRTKQSREESDAAFLKASETLKAKPAMNITTAHILDAYLSKHFTDAEGVADYSAENMLEALWRCRDILEWENNVQPTLPKDILAQNPQSSLNEHNSPRTRSEKYAQQERDRKAAEAKAAEAKRNEADEAQKALIATVVRYCSNAGFSGQPHSGIARGRDALHRELERLVKAGVKADRLLSMIKDYHKQNERELCLFRFQV